MESIQVVKLTSGEEIIGNLKTDEKTGEMAINFPKLILHGVGGQMSLAPWLVTEEAMNETTYSILNPYTVITTGTPHTTLIEAYEKMKQKVFGNIEIQERPSLIVQ